MPPKGVSGRRSTQRRRWCILPLVMCNSLYWQCASCYSRHLPALDMHRRLPVKIWGIYHQKGPSERHSGPCLAKSRNHLPGEEETKAFSSSFQENDWIDLDNILEAKGIIEKQKEKSLFSLEQIIMDDTETMKVSVNGANGIPEETNKRATKPKIKKQKKTKAIVPNDSLQDGDMLEPDVGALQDIGVQLGKVIKNKGGTKKQNANIADKQLDNEPRMGTTPASERTDTKEKAAKKTSKRKQKTPAGETAPLYWKDHNDEFVLRSKDATSVTIDVNEDEDGRSQSTFTAASNKIVKFTVRGKPIPLRRHRTARGFVYNPSAGAQDAFRNVVQSLLPPLVDTEDGLMMSGIGPTLFHENEFVVMTIVFRLRRPRNHFKSNKPEKGFRPSAPGLLHPIKTDVDNLAKFVLDSLNGLLYVDDQQVISLHATKVYDTDGDCEGATDIIIRTCNEDQVEALIKNLVDI